MSNDKLVWHKHSGDRCPVPERIGIYVPLTKGQFALVDREDYERVAAFKWRAAVKSKCGGFYAIRTAQLSDGPAVKDKIIYMHCFVIGVFRSVDHRDSNGLDNRKSNLRQCTSHENCMNRRVSSLSTIGIKGVRRTSCNSSRFESSISFRNRKFFLGTFGSADEAAHAYNKAAISLHGDFASLNPVGVDPHV